MSLPSNIIKEEIERTLFLLKEREKDETISKLRAILYANLDRGRIDGFVDSNIANVQKYVLRVINHHERLSPLLNELQVARSTEAWQPLFGRMQKWAYNFLLGQGFYVSQETANNANACATEATIAILDAHFPYDTEFDSWAHVLVQNTCRKFIRKSTRKSIIPQQQLVSLENTEILKLDNSLKDERQQKEFADELAEVLKLLSQSRKDVIDLHYFQGYSFPEIATKMNKTIGAIHSLHFNALRDIRKILYQNRNNLDE